MKLTLGILALAAVAAAVPAKATVTLNFNSPFNGGVSSNLADAAGTVTNGLAWGIIVDVTGTGTFSTTYDAINVTLGSTTTLSNGNVLILAPDATANTSAFVEGDFSTPGGDGGVSSLVSIPLIPAAQAATGISTGDQFRLVWFDPSGKTAGFITSATFTIPSDSATSDYADPFVGTDPIRPATGISFVPEPASALLGMLGMLGFLRRRR